MTEQNTAYRNDQDNMADDDPLAELARIVASRPAQPKKPVEAANLANSTAPKPVARDEFDIEAALMQELGEAEAAKPAPAKADPTDRILPPPPATVAKRPLATPTIARDKPASVVAKPASAPLADREMSLEDQLMAELAGSPDSDSIAGTARTESSKSAALHGAEVQGQSSNHPDEDDGDAFERLAKAASDLRDLGKASAAQVSTGLANDTGEDPDLEDFFEQNFEGLIETPGMAPEENQNAQQQMMANDLEADLDFGEAFEQAVDDRVVTQASTMADEHALENDFAKAFANELEFADDEDVRPLPERYQREADLAGNIHDDRPGDPMGNRHTSGDNEFYGDERIPDPVTGRVKSKRGFRLAIFSLCLALVLGTAIVGYGSLGPGSSTSDGEPQVIKADVEPSKVKPENPGGKEIANQDNEVYNKVAGTGEQDAVQNELISAREEPIAIEAKSDTRLMPDGQPESDQATIGLSPKRVKTLTVKPDGTIVTATVEPTTENALVASANTDAATTQALDATGQVTNEPAAEQVATPAMESIDGAVTTGKIAVPEFSPLPMPEPSVATAAPKPVAPKPVAPKVAEVPAADPNAPTQIASLQQAPAAPAALPTVSSSEWKVQVSSQRSREDAEASFNNIKSRFSSIVGDRAAAIQQADVEGKGTFYRVKILAEDKETANQLCSRLKSAGGSCFVTR
jgi:hypothetical protein